MTPPVLKYDVLVSKPLVEEIMSRSGQNLQSCYQCRRCAAGCPVGEETGVTPDRLIRMILVGDREAALNNLLVWKCVACYTCGTRCPNNIQTARINETLKQMSKEAHCKPLTPRIADFHNAFMTTTRHLGRFNEIESMAIYETKTLFKELAKGNLKAMFEEMMSQGKLGAAMTKKKRMHFDFDRIKNRSEVKALYKKSKGR
ncbi:MAG TPA: 4Fe-4S dicluster domain-containing protein [Nitrospirota bacterium]|nr:4Fe-4S dicluster domain-containing protein [Nitrospirota bacterium]